MSELAPDKWRAAWPDPTGLEWTKEFATERDAIEHVVTHASGGVHFHDLRHSYATWLVTAGVPVNVVRAMMGHESTSTTLNLTPTPSDLDGRVRRVSVGCSTTVLTIR